MFEIVRRGDNKVLASTEYVDIVGTMALALMQKWEAEIALHDEGYWEIEIWKDGKPYQRVEVKSLPKKIWSLRDLEK